MQVSEPLPLWSRTSSEPVVDGDADAEGICDVAIVGGGYTGLSTALHAAQAGLSAHVLEAEEIGHGGSGRNVGLVNAGLWLPPRAIRHSLGEAYGPRFVARFNDGPRVVFDLIERHQIRCEATRTGTIHAARGPRGMRDLHARHAQWQDLNQPVALLSAAEIAERTGTQVFRGGLLDHRAGTINPAGYVRGLARAARAAGASISTRTRVTALRRSDEGWRLRTSRGTLRATHVVLATNAYSDTLWPGLNAGYSLIHFFQCATAPLGPEAAHILPGRQGLWDTGPIMFSCRRDAQGRLIIGSMGRVIGAPDRGLSRRWAARQVQRVFPELGRVAFGDAWHGRIAMTPDHLPRVHQLAPGLWTAIGYNGRGITSGTLFGQALAGLLTGAAPQDLPLPVTAMTRLPRAGLVTRLHDLAFTANQVWTSL